MRARARTHYRAYAGKKGGGGKGKNCVWFVVNLLSISYKENAQKTVCSKLT